MTLNYGLLAWGFKKSHSTILGVFWGFSHPPPPPHLKKKQKNNIYLPAILRFGKQENQEIFESRKAGPSLEMSIPQPPPPGFPSLVLECTSQDMRKCKLKLEDFTLKKIAVKTMWSIHPQEIPQIKSPSLTTADLCTMNGAKNHYPFLDCVHCTVR